MAANYSIKNVSHQRRVSFRLEKQIDEPWQIRNGTYWHTYGVSYYPVDDKGNLIKDANDKPIVRSFTVTKNCTFGDGGTSNIIDGGYKHYIIDFTFPVDMQTTKEITGTTTSSEDFKFQVGWWSDQNE